MQGLCLQRFFVCAERTALSVDALFSLLRRPDGDDAVDDELREAPPGQRPEILLIVQFERLSPLQHQLARQRFVLDRELELVGLDRPGIRSKAAGSIQSYEFEFSVENEALARELMLQGGKTLELHYKEYFGALPWRGFTKFVVDSIITVRPAEQGKQGVDR